MRHIISVTLQNEAGALARVANLVSSRGYNIESLNVAPTDNESVSRVTLVTLGSDKVIEQIAKQLGKLVDVVTIVDMTGTDHIERELALLKLDVSSGRGPVQKRLDDFGARVLDNDGRYLTLELVGVGQEIDRLLEDLERLVPIESFVRTGPLAMARGASLLARR